MGRSELDRVGVLSDRSLIPSEGYRGAYRLSVRAGNATSIRKKFPLPDETLCSGHLILKDSSAAKLRVPRRSFPCRNAGRLMMKWVDRFT